jgi:putative FmdB family regulatory protein
MPTYEYICDACRHEYETYQSIKDAPLKKCPECGKAKLRRKLGTGGGFIFKGSGFYITDYRSESYKKAAESDKPSSEKPDSAKDSKPAETPAEKTPAKPAAAKSESPKKSKPKSKE